MDGTGAAPRAVFVDPTGRRSRRVARTCWVLGGLGVAYVALVVVSLLLPPGLSRLTVPGLGAVLPGPAAAPLADVQGEKSAPDVLLAPSARPATATPSPTPRSAASVGPRPTLTPTTPPTGGAPSAQPVGSSPAPPGRSTTAPTTAPTRRATTAPAAPTAPPGQASRTPRPRPSPSRPPR